jgi:hypothetical protein
VEQVHHAGGTVLACGGEQGLDLVWTQRARAAISSVQASCTNWLRTWEIPWYSRGSRAE